MLALKVDVPALSTQLCLLKVRRWGIVGGFKVWVVPIVFFPEKISVNLWWLHESNG